MIYTGGTQKANWNGYNAAQLIISGTTSAINAGLYIATFKPTANYQWTDGSTVEKSIVWSIAKAEVSMPTQNGALVYNGNAQSPAWGNYDSEKLTIDGDTSGTNAGDYTVTFTPTVNLQWADGTTIGKNATWTIAKAAGSLSLDKTSLSFSAANETDTITVTRSGDGAITAVSSDTNVVTVSVSGTTVTITSVESGDAVVTVTVTVAESTNYTAPAANVFGVCWNMSSSSTALTRLTKSNDPNGLCTVDITTNSVPAVGTGAGSSPFDNYSPWKDMEEYNIINNVVSHKRGDAGFSRTNYDTMVYIPTFYYRIFDNGGKRYFYISDAEISGFEKHPGSNKYVGRYNTISGYTSKTGAVPLVKITRAAARTDSRKKGGKWGQYDYATWCAVWLLYLVEFADWNSQAKIGQGLVSSGVSQNTGGTGTMSYHTGRAAGTDGQTAVQYRHIEDPWGNFYEWIDGINFSDGTVYVCTDPANYADDTATGHINIGSKIQSSGYIKSLGLSSKSLFSIYPSIAGRGIIGDERRGDGYEKKLSK